MSGGATATAPLTLSPSLPSLALTPNADATPTPYHNPPGQADLLGVGRSREVEDTRGLVGRAAGAAIEPRRHRPPQQPLPPPRRHADDAEPDERVPTERAPGKGEAATGEDADVDEVAGQAQHRLRKHRLQRLRAPQPGAGLRRLVGRRRRSLRAQAGLAPAGDRPAGLRADDDGAPARQRGQHQRGRGGSEEERADERGAAHGTSASSAGGRCLPPPTHNREPYDTLLYCPTSHVPTDPYAEWMPRADCSSNTIRDSISRVAPFTPPRVVGARCFWKARGFPSALNCFAVPFAADQHTNTEQNGQGRSLWTRHWD